MKKIIKYLLVFCLISCGCSFNSYNDDALTKQEISATYNTQLGIGYLQQGDIPLAKEKLNKALSQGPNLPMTHYSMGYFLEKTGNFVQAEKEYKKAINLGGSRLGESYNNYGTFLCRQKRYNEAEKVFLSAVTNKLYTKTAEAYENAGLCALGSGNKEKAKLYFEKALLQDIQRPNALLELADIYLQHGDYKQGATYLEQYRNLGLINARLLALQIKAAMGLGDKDKIASDLLLLKHNYPNSNEYKMLKQQEAEIL